jgi:hypothetical protein
LSLPIGVVIPTRFRKVYFHSSIARRSSIVLETTFPASNSFSDLFRTFIFAALKYGAPANEISNGILPWRRDWRTKNIESRRHAESKRREKSVCLFFQPYLS